MTALLRFGKAQSDNFQFKFQNPDTCLGTFTGFMGTGFSGLDEFPNESSCDFLSFSAVLAVWPCNIFRWPDISWNYGDSTRDDKGRVQRCVYFPYYAGQIC